MTALSVSKVFIKIVALLGITLPLKTKKTKDCNLRRRSERSEDYVNQVKEAIQVRRRRSVGQKGHIFTPRVNSQLGLCQQSD